MNRLDKWRRRLMSAPFHVLFTVFLGTFRPAAAHAQTNPQNLANTSLEDLMNIEITSASRKEERAADAAAAVHVITHEEIQRSGMTTIPDLLRLVPGVDVAQINSNKWAVSVRGFNGLYANKLLVLVDGRSLYNRIFSGVLWSSEDLLLDDVDRIEVIRGPGAAVWGANAVNGVINIVTRSAADTRGGLVRVDGGSFQSQGAARYGGTVGSGAYRLYSQWTENDRSLIVPGSHADDASHNLTSGFRADWSTRPSAFVVEGSFTAGQQRALWPNLDPQTASRAPIANDPSDSQGGHLLGRWTHSSAGGASLQVQSFVDIEHRQEPIANYDRNVIDIDSQYHRLLGAHHDLVAGAGFRFLDEKFAGHVGFALNPAQATSRLVTAFAQDEVRLAGGRVAVTLGAQIQNDHDVGAGVQPTARVLWKVTESQRLWAAVSRALRTPSLYERGIGIDFPPAAGPGGVPLLVGVRGNPSAQTENFADAEGGYRLEIGRAASVDATGFIGRYDNLHTQEPTSPIFALAPTPHISAGVQFDNLLKADTRGFEVASHWSPIAAWHLDASYTFFRLVPHPGTSLDPASAAYDGNAPRHQWQLHSGFPIGRRGTLDAMVLHVGMLEQTQVVAYTRADVRGEWRVTEQLSAIAVGQNLLDAAHREFAGRVTFLTATQIPRSASVRLRWMF
jgi:iron complex outermembrane receptor protein